MNTLWVGGQMPLRFHVPLRMLEIMPEVEWRRGNRQTVGGGAASRAAEGGTGRRPHARPAVARRRRSRRL